MLTGSVFFDFGVESSQLHDLVERAIGERVAMMLKWKALAEPVSGGSNELSPTERLLAAHEVIRERQRQRRFRQAVFTMMYRHDDDPADPVTLRTGVKIAGMDWQVVEEAIERDGDRLLGEVRTQADGAGIEHLPAFVATGPAVTIKLTPAASSGSARSKLEIIERMAADDGIWSLAKP